MWPFSCVALEYDGHIDFSPQRTRLFLTRGRYATDRCQQAHALCHLPNTSPSRSAAAAVWARPGALGAIAVLCRDQVEPPKVTLFLLLHVSSILLHCSYTLNSRLILLSICTLSLAFVVLMLLLKNNLLGKTLLQIQNATCNLAQVLAMVGKEQAKDVYHSVTNQLFARLVKLFKITKCVWSGKGPKT